jgi:serine/threonine protein kinase
MMFSEDYFEKETYQICKAVDALHERNIVHQDIKLENIFITNDNNFKLGNFVFISIFFFIYIYIYYEK